MSTKSNLNKNGWVTIRHGLKRVANGENGKGSVTIPWNFVKKKSTGVSGLKHVICKTNDVDLYVLEKMIDGQRVMGVFDTKREALKYFDKALISRGKEPKFIFKKA